MKQSRVVVVTLAAAWFATSPVAARGSAFKGSKLAGEARISLAAARMTALKARPGTITDQELEREKGGSGLRYSFDITSNREPYEVGVDAKTGAILENATEGKNPD